MLCKLQWHDPAKEGRFGATTAGPRQKHNTLPASSAAHGVPSMQEHGGSSEAPANTDALGDVQYILFRALPTATLL